MVQAFENEQGTEFFIFCSNRDLDGTVLPVATGQWNAYTANCKVWYQAGEVSAELAKLVHAIQPDLFFIVGIYDQAYNFKPLLRWRHIPKIISVRGMLNPGALTQKGIKKKVYLQWWKLLGVHKKNIFHATSVEEKTYIETCFGDAVDVRVAANLPAPVDYQQPTAKEPGVLKMCTIALISPMKNHLLVLQALSQVPAQYQVEYDIYGPVKDKSYWNDCREMIKQLSPNIQVNYHGDIDPLSVIATLAKTQVVIQPSKSENYGHSLYEALLAGRPVITSNSTPWNGLWEKEAGINADPEQKDALKNAIEYFAACGNEQYKAHAAAARQYAMQAVDQQATRDQYKKLFAIA